jgi:hypothetical protein
MARIREKLTPTQRATELRLTIDPGFVHHRKVQTIIGHEGMIVVDRLIAELPELPAWQKEVRIDHIYTKVMLALCNQIRVKPLEEVLAEGPGGPGQIFCSTEVLEPGLTPKEGNRAVSIWIPRGSYHRRVEFHYSAGHVSSDTLRSRLREKATISIIAELYRMDDEVIIFDPIIMGFPWLEAEGIEPDFDIIWFGYGFFEHFVEDFDEFNLVHKVPAPPDPEPMRLVSEKAFKECLRTLLGDTASSDWGGEASDYFTAHLHLKGRRVTGAFLLKGPSHVAPMGLNHLGKNNDQIVRLAREPAQVLIVQHSHDILPPVRDTLRAFAVQPSNPRRYCLIDGRDSLRLLQAYNLYDSAVELSKNASS